MENNYKKSGIIHKLIRKEIEQHLYVGISSLEIVKLIENDINKFTKFNESEPLKSGIAFPVGISINEIAAHFTPSINKNPNINSDDLIKIDFGVHINGCITDGAFSWCPSGKYNDLIDISVNATNIGIKNSGPDACLGDIGFFIQEYIESKELEYDNKLYNIKSIYDLCGHKIKPYIIHSDKAVPNIKIPYFKRMVEDEVYAIETFPTLGSGEIETLSECNHFMINKYSKNFDNKSKMIYNIRKTLAFCPRWFDFNIPDNKYISKYPILKSDGIVAQTEKTIYIQDKGVYILN